jgi:hypothetical protein
MKHDLNYAVRLNADTKHKNLYSWCLQETDAAGEVIGRDLIPWSYRLYFDVSELQLIAAVEVGSVFSDDPADNKPARATRTIRAQLKPEADRSGRMLNRNTAYSMMGTGRRQVSLELIVEPTSRANPEEVCRAWGSPAYTSELDFCEVTEPDIVVFHLYVSPQAFETYARQIETDAVTHATFRVGFVKGFYSDWSPSISTDLIKILTANKEHGVAIPKGCEIDPPTLGGVGDARFTLWKTVDLSTTQPVGLDLNEPEAHPAAPISASKALDPRIDRMLSSLRIAAWLVVVLLVILVFK